ncbi:Ammonium transporter 1 member 3 [Eufriesea mexicana]|uniref:putative ammonium transporter sll1017 n=1 Tax=Eufriesea mexicana TaxID=516756 RepID=UPI00083C4111|nr:PREDICTED: putative ammonium transporter sll1017 [Eufriesea mexicana]OAD62911.1 Ammonium transporter 1 member 3 [Eufriesea mexicana]
MSHIFLDDFEYSYYDYPSHNRTDHTNLISNFNSWLGLIRVLLVVLLRVGFVLIHVGSVPVNNVNLILLQNILDFCWVTVVYILVGSVIAYTGDVHGVVAEGYWIGDAIVDKDEVIIGWSAVVIAAAICTCGIVGRTHTVGYLMIGLVLAGVVQPFLIHWIWTPKGWIRFNAFNEKNVHFHDYAGSVIVHLVGGLSGLIGCLTLGRRILRLEAIDDASIAVGSSGTVFAGQLLVFIGLQSLNMPNMQLEKFEIKIKRQYDIIINNLLAASSCSLLVVAFHFVLPREEFNHWTVMRCVQATVAGLVIVSAGTDIYSPQAAIGLGSTGSIIFYLISRQVFQSALEDYCNIVAIHLVCAILGSFLVPFFNIGENDNVTSVLLNFCWQLICLTTITIFVAIIMFVAFAVLQCSGLLRNRSEYLNHLRASIAEGRTRRRSVLERLFRADRDPIYLQPGSTFGEQPDTDAHTSKYQNEDDARRGRHRPGEVMA